MSRNELFQLASLLVLLLLGLTSVFYNPIAQEAARHNTDVTVEVAGLYGTIRLIGGVVSIAKDADAEAGPLVATLTVSPGQVLQPVSDTIDRFADLLFGVGIISGVLGALVIPAAQLGGLSLAFGTLMMIGCVGLARRIPSSLPLFRMGRACLSIGIVLALLVPSAFAIAAAMSDKLTAEAWDKANAVFDEFSSLVPGDEDLKALGIEASATTASGPMTANESVSSQESNSIMESIADWLPKMGAESAMESTVQTAGKMAGILLSASSTGIEAIKLVPRLVSAAGELFNASIHIAVAYLIKLVVLPALIFGSMLWLIRQTFRPKISDRDGPNL